MSRFTYYLNCLREHTTLALYLVWLALMVVTYRLLTAETGIAPEIGYTLLVMEIIQGFELWRTMKERLYWGRKEVPPRLLLVVLMAIPLLFMTAPTFFEPDDQTGVLAVLIAFAGIALELAVLTLSYWIILAALIPQRRPVILELGIARPIMQEEN